MSNKKQVALGGLVAAAIGFSAPSLSAETSKFYAGLGIGQTTVTDDSIGFDGTDTSFKVFGGYSVNKYLSIEAAYLNAGEPDDVVFGSNVSVEGTTFNAAVLGAIPLNQSFSLYGRLGVIFWDAEASAGGFSQDDNGNDLAYGIGAAFNAGPAKVRLEWEAADLDGTDLRVLSLAAAWSF